MNNFLNELKLKLKNIKHIEIILALLVVSILALVYFSSLSKNESEKIKENEETEVSNVSLENRLSNIISQISGVGGVDVMIIPQEEGNVNDISSIIVVAEGADNINVKLNILTAIQTLFNVDSNRIQIFAK